VNPLLFEQVAKSRAKQVVIVYEQDSGRKLLVGDVR
jgi:hypothetical protein